MKDFLQGANRGFVTGLLGAPVDLTTMALRPLGYSHPSPFMSSGWIDDKLVQAGIYPKKTGSTAETVGELAGGLLDPGGVVGAAGKAGALLKGAAVKGLLADPTILGTFLAHTPLKPDPTVGKRFASESVGGLADKKPVKIEDLKGSSIQIMPWDSTNRNRQITSVSEEKLARPVVTTGGQDFARDLSHIQAGVGGASNRGIAERIMDRARVARDENVASGGNGQVYQLPVTMGDYAENFSTMPTDVLLGLIDAQGLTKRKAAEIDKMVRNYVPENMVGKGVLPFKDFRGINTDAGRQQLYTGEGLGSTAGELRKAFVNRMYLKDNQRDFKFNREDVQGALFDPALVGVPKGYAGNTVIRALPDAPLTASTHPSYDTNFPGVYAGSLLDSVPAEVLMPKAFSRIAPEFAGKKSDQRTMVLGALEKRKEGVSELVDDQTIESVNRWLEQQARQRGR